MDADALDDHLDQLVVHGRIIPRAMRAAVRGAPPGRPPTDGARRDEDRDDRPDHEPADVGEERDATGRLGDAERSEPVESCSTNQNPSTMIAGTLMSW